MSRNVNPPLSVGDRVVLIHMDDPFTPMTIGTKGVVTNVSDDPFETDGMLYAVHWDNGSKLSLVSAVDKWLKESDINKKQIKESTADDLLRMSNLLKFTKTKLIFNFLVLLRDSGIVNMFQSTDFLWSGSDFLRKFIDFEEAKGINVDEDIKEELISMADEVRAELISSAIKYLESVNKEVTPEAVNRQVKDLAKKSLTFKMSAVPKFLHEMK